MSIVEDLAGEELRTRVTSAAVLQGTTCQAQGRGEEGMTNHCQWMQTTNAMYR